MTIAAITDTDLNTFLTGGAGDLDPADDKMLKLMLPNALEMVSKFLGWYPSQASAIEYYPSERVSSRQPFGLDLGIGGSPMSGGFPPFSREYDDQTLILRRRPIRSVTSVYDNLSAWDVNPNSGDWPTDTLLPDGSYWLDNTEAGFCQSGKLYRLNGWYRTKPRTVKVTYVYGFTSDELRETYPNIQLAIMMTAAFWAGKGKSAAGSFKVTGAGAGRLPASVSVRDFSVSFGGGSQNQYGTSSGGGTGGVGAGIPDDVIPLLLPHVSMAKYLP